MLKVSWIFRFYLFLILMFRSWLRYPSISNRLIHTVTRQENEGKKKVVVLGAGWWVLFFSIICITFIINFYRGGFQFLRYLNRSKYDVTLVSNKILYLIWYSLRQGLSIRVENYKKILTLMNKFFLHEWFHAEILFFLLVGFTT